MEETKSINNKPDAPREENVHGSNEHPTQAPPPPPFVKPAAPEEEVESTKKTLPFPQDQAEQPKVETVTEEDPTPQDQPNSQSRARSISPELLVEYGGDFSKTLTDLPDGDVSLLMICDKYEVVKGVAKDILTEANRHVRRYFNPVDDTGGTSTSKLPTISKKGLMIGGRYFKQAKTQFNLGDQFTVQFHDDDPNKITLLRVHPAPSGTSANEKE